MMALPHHPRRCSTGVRSLANRRNGIPLARALSRASRTASSTSTWVALATVKAWACSSRQMSRQSNSGLRTLARKYCRASAGIGPGPLINILCPFHPCPEHGLGQAAGQFLRILVFKNVRQAPGEVGRVRRRLQGLADRVDQRLDDRLPIA